MTEKVYPPQSFFFSLKLPWTNPVLGSRRRTLHGRSLRCCIPFPSSLCPRRSVELRHLLRTEEREPPHIPAKASAQTPRDALSLSLSPEVFAARLHAFLSFSPPLGGSFHFHLAVATVGGPLPFVTCAPPAFLAAVHRREMKPAGDKAIRRRGGEKRGQKIFSPLLILSWERNSFFLLLFSSTHASCPDSLSLSRPSELFVKGEGGEEEKVLSNIKRKYYYVRRPIPPPPGRCSRSGKGGVGEGGCTSSSRGGHARRGNTFFRRGGEGGNE